ncbi:helix-turn-helix domain-containing protein [Slackia exigua]|uniref:helix-turn-helix domain-containing protein n=1 Tax=Slackia exigua TaxID=84109 RepID=UPI0023F580AD|nr:helix-turn-helix domain-containing protein [Slackia exigua]
MKDVMDVTELAACLGISRRTVERMIADGRISHAHKIARRWYVNAAMEWPDVFGREKEIAPGQRG